jgi:hypothetical protein
MATTRKAGTSVGHHLNCSIDIIFVLDIVDHRVYIGGGVVSHIDSIMRILYFALL